jgi:tetratricopeptide (TPR) repeat protein
MYFVNKDVVNALKYYQAAASLDPHSTMAWQGVGRCYYHLGKKDMALDAFNKALALDPTNAQLQKTILFLGGQVPAPGAPAPAVAPTPASVTNIPAAPAVSAGAAPVSADAYLAAGDKLLGSQNYALALKYYQASANANPSAPAFEGEGRCYYYLGQKDQAMQAFQTSLALNPNNVGLQNFISTIK